MYHYCMPYVNIIYNETGIILLQFGEHFVAGMEPSGEKKPVLTLSDLLEPLYEFFDTIVTIDTTVYEIRLGYIASFSDGVYEPMRRLLTPAWIVKYDTKIKGKRSEVQCFDGYTGAPLQENINYL